MTKRTTDGMGEELQGYVDYWQIRLGLSGWDIEVRFNLSQHFADAAVIGGPEYMTARLRFNTRRMRREKCTSEELEASVVHEMIHIVLWEAIGEHHHDEQERSEERAVQMLTRALMKRE